MEQFPEQTILTSSQNKLSVKSGTGYYLPNSVFVPTSVLSLILAERRNWHSRSLRNPVRAQGLQAEKACQTTLPASQPRLINSTIQGCKTLTPSSRSVFDVECRRSVAAYPCSNSELPGEAETPVKEPFHRAAAVLHISEASDELLGAGTRAGDKQDPGVLFHRHARSVRNAACRILRNEGGADDLLEEVFLFIFRQAAWFDSSLRAAPVKVISL